MEAVMIKSGEQPRYFPFGTPPNTVNNTTIVAASQPIYKESPYSTFQGIVSGTGVVTASITIQGTNDPTTAAGVASNWVTLGIISLTGTTSASDGFTTTATWRFARANVTTISGTSATVQVIMGV